MSSTGLAALKPYEVRRVKHDGKTTADVGRDSPHSCQDSTAYTKDFQEPSWRKINKKSPGARTEGSGRRRGHLRARPRTRLRRRPTSAHVGGGEGSARGLGPEGEL